ncbi:MAG TPA: prenyltransferase/squalene oxidase repeat-containing protein [Planctomycetota bacterium]|nr:prenyltransferase/squalene oxidase repeat-containing protein [Planctomycetota bacterium]
MKKILKWIGIIGGSLLLLLVALGAYLWVFEKPSHSAPKTPPKQVAASGDKILDSIRKGAEYLKVHQEVDGHFSKGMLDPKPAFSAMVVDALARSPDKYTDKNHPFIKKSVEAILKYQQPDGSICSPYFPLQTYVTSVSIMALVALENPEYQPAIDKAREYLRTAQNKEEESMNKGGAGYSAGGKVSGDVTAMWVEAMAQSGVKEGDPAFENAKKFFSRMQNDPEKNKEPAPGTEVGKDGGLFYAPGKNHEKLKSEKGESGKAVLKSYGMMTYAGLKSFLYMYVDKNDSRVKSAFRWIKNNYTLEENRHLGADGLYYYYLTMAKALAAYGEPIIETPDGVKHNWAEELSDKLISLQSPEGYWMNKQSNEWMEDDRVLVSAYAIRTLTICHEFLAKQKSLLAEPKDGEKKVADEKPAEAPKAEPTTK